MRVRKYNTFAKTKNAEFVGWVERSGTQHSLGSVALHPTYKKMAKVLLEKPGFWGSKKRSPSLIN